MDTQLEALDRRIAETVLDTQRLHIESHLAAGRPDDLLWGRLIGAAVVHHLAALALVEGEA